MNVYAIVLDEPSQYAWDQIKSKWKNSYCPSDTLAFIAPGEGAITSEISDHIGMNDENEVKGVVFQISHYYGWHDKALWEWLIKHE